MTQEIINVGGYPNDPSADTIQEGFEKVNTNFTTLFDAASNVDFVGVADGQAVVLLASQGISSNTITVAALPTWSSIAGTTVTVGFCCTNNGNAWSCIIGGQTSASGGPLGPTPTGAAVIDNAAQWFYLGVASATASVFAATDIGKVICVIRQDVYSGCNPWNNGANFPAVGHCEITGYNSPTSVNISLAGVSAPAAYPVYPTQSWPYNSTPSLIMWGSDNTPALQSVLNQAKTAPVGLKVSLPSGNYCFGGQCAVYSNTWVDGDWASTVLMPVGVHDAAGQSNVVTLFSNAAGIPSSNYTAIIGPNSAAAALAKSGNQNIRFSNFSVDMRATGQSFGYLMIRGFLVQNFMCTNVTGFGSPLNCFEGPVVTSCNNTTIENCYLWNTASGFSPWGGWNQIYYKNNFMTMPYNGISPLSGSQPNGGTNINQFTGIQINIVGTVDSGPDIDDEVSNTLICTGNSVYMNGSANQSLKSIGIIYFPDGRCSVGVNIEFSNNLISAVGSNNQALDNSGQAFNMRFNNNKFIGSDGAGESTFTLQSQAANTSSGAPGTISSIATVNTDTTATITWPSHGATLSNTTAQLYFFTIGVVPIAGLNIGGYYLVLSIPDANTIIIQLPSAANATTSVTWQQHNSAGLNNPFTVTMGSNVVTVVDAGFSPGQGNEIIITGSTALNGVTFDGTWYIQTILSPTSYTFVALQSASSGGTGGGAAVNINYPVSFSQIQMFPIGVQIMGNTFQDCGSAAGLALIQTHGIDVVVANNDARLTSGASTGSYLSLVSFDNIQSYRGGIASCNTGPPGTGAVTAGNNRVSWNTFEEKPVVIDTDDVNALLNLSQLGALYINTSVGNQPYALQFVNNASGAWPAFGSFGGALAFNLSGGAEEFAIINTNNQVAGATSFEFVQQTGTASGTTVLAVNPQLMKVAGAYVDASAAHAVPTTGQTVAIAYGVTTQIIDPAGALVALTVVSPAYPAYPNPANSVQYLEIIFTQAITTITWTAGSATAYSGVALPTSVTAGQTVLLRFAYTLAKWIHVVSV